MDDRNHELEAKKEDEFLEQLVAVFKPKVVQAAREGWAWWQIRHDVREILDGKAEERVVGLPKDRRSSARAGYDRFHSRVIARLKAFYPIVDSENN